MRFVMTSSGYRRVLRVMGVLLLAGAMGKPVARAGNDGPAEDLPRFTLDDCLDIGLRKATPQAIAALDERIAAASIEQVRAQVLPQLAATGAYTRLDELTRFDTPDGTFELGRLDNFNAGIEVQQLLYAGGSVRSALKAAHHYRGLSRAETRRVVQGLRLEIHTGFYGLLLARRRVEVHRASVEQVRAMAEEADRRFRAGAGSEFEALSARVRLANERPALLAAERDYRVARLAFRDLVRLPADDFEPDGELEFTGIKVDDETMKALARDHRPELEIMRMQRALLRSDIRAEQGNFLPSVHARAAYLGSNPPSFAAADDEWDWRWEAGIALRWSLFDGALTRHRVREKRRELEKADHRLDELLRAIDREIEQALLHLAFAEESAMAGRETAELAERNLDIARTRYDTGMITWLEYTDAQLALHTAQLNWAAALRDHRAAIAHLAHAMGLTVQDIPRGVAQP